MPSNRMTAGRELDALIAERVFAAMIHEGRYGDYMTLPGERPVSDQRPVPCYSTNIAAAWEVVEKLTGFVSKRAEPWWSVAVFNAQPSQIMCRVYACQPGWRIDDDATAIAEDIADTVPLAICRAALAALSVAEPPHAE